MIYLYLYNFVENLKHKFWVFYYSCKIASKLIYRASIHDLSKFRNDEALGFSKHIRNLRKIQFGQEEYKSNLEKLRPVISLHHSRNRHHPEYHKNGFADMSFLDRLEMLVDWRASTRRNNGNIFNSILHNLERFGYSQSDKEWLTLMAKEL